VDEESSYVFSQPHLFEYVDDAEQPEIVMGDGAGTDMAATMFCSAWLVILAGIPPRAAQSVTALS
jgi:hypothetical protein